MDCTISPNYQNITFAFRLQYWEVSSAIHISSGIEVSIWKFLYSDINSKYSEAEIFSFLSKYRSSLIASQHIHHFNILRIFEISDENDPLSFSSERIAGSLSQEKNITTDEAYYMISQLCVALHYLHQDLHVAYLAISPDNILLSPSFNLKLANLVHFGKFSNYDSPIEPNLYPLNSSIFDIDSNFASPEIKNNQPLTSYSDVYSFALILIYVFTRDTPTKYPINVSKLNIPEDTKKIVEQCLLTKFDQRPTFEQILQYPSLNPVTVRVLNFIPKINESSFEIRQNFFEKLTGMLSLYSPRLLSLKFVPIITKEVTENKELNQQLLPLLLIAAETISALDNYNLIFQPLFKIEQCANYFFEKALTMTDASIFVPILISAYQSNFKSISSRRNELLKSINALENINSIICLIENLNDEAVIDSILQVLQGKIEISDSVLFIRQLKHLYKKYNSNLIICNSISNTLMSLQPNAEYAQKAVSLSLSLTKSHIHKSDKQKLIQFAEKFLVLVRDQIESEKTESTGKLNPSKSSNQILSLACEDDDVENISGRKGKKKHKEKKDRRGRRSSLTNSSNLKKLQLGSSKNNTFSNSQKLFDLPRGINPLSLKNPFIREIDLFSFREYINSQTPAFEIRDLDPFEVSNENKRRMSDMTLESSSGSNDEEGKEIQLGEILTEKVPPLNINVPERRDVRINRSHRRSMSSQSLSGFANFEDMNQKNPFSAKNSVKQLNETPKASPTTSHANRKHESAMSDDDSSGPFKVSNKNSFFSSSGIKFGNTTANVEKSSSTKISAFNFAMINQNPDEDDGRSKSARKKDPPSVVIGNSPGEVDSLQSAKLKTKRSRTKSRPFIPTPPPKKSKKNDQ